MQNIAKALIEFQNRCPAIDKDSKVSVGQKYNFQYASFGNIVQTIKNPMYESKLAYTFVMNEGMFTCRILHESGEYLDTSFPMPKMRENMQENGSLFTYCKRYALVLALGLDTDADDDCNTAMGNDFTMEKKIHNYAPKSPTMAPQQTDSQKGAEWVKEGKKVSEAQLKRLDAIAYKTGWSFGDIASLCNERFKCGTHDLNMKQYDELCNYIQSNKPKEESMMF